eukprot:270597-Lingulodinium_polyedra.AAC.1
MFLAIVKSLEEGFVRACAGQRAPVKLGVVRASPAVASSWVKRADLNQQLSSFRLASRSRPRLFAV